MSGVDAFILMTPLATATVAISSAVEAGAAVHDQVERDGGQAECSATCALDGAE